MTFSDSSIHSHIELPTLPMTLANTGSDGYLHPPDASNRASRNSKSSMTLLSDTSSRSSTDQDNIALTPARTPSRNSNMTETSIEFPNRNSGSSDGDNLSDISSLYSPDFSTFERRQKTPKQIIRELTVEVMPALLVSVAGSICAGYILGQIQNNPAFDRIPALFIMVPVMLNLKSNTELNMSTRMSTLANLGIFDSKAEGIKAVRSNLELLLLQSTVVGTSVGLISTILSLVPSSSNTSGVVEFLLQASILMASGIGCAVIGSSLIGLLISFTVYVSHAHGVDPDNIGTPIASSFGDMSTLLILGLLTSLLMSVMQTPWPTIITLGFMALGLLLLKVVRDNDQTRDHLSKGWLPLVYAAVTSSIAGIVVEKFADRYPGMPALVPVLNGIGGNIGTVFASRLSTSLHRRHQDTSAEHNLVMFILLIINIPIQIGFLALHRVFDPSLTVNVWFVFVYISATILHGLAILSLAKIACRVLWARGYDPDDCVNPFITGSGDMLGTILLALVFTVG